MKNIAITLLMLGLSMYVSAQTTVIPDVDMRDLDGNIVSSLQIAQPGTSTLVIFWKSTSGKCCDNLDLLQDAWDDTLGNTGMRMVAICIDCNGSWSHIKPIVNGNSWDFDTFIDVNGDFKRAMAVSDVPCTMLFDEEQNLVCRYNSFCAGSQEMICKNIFEHLNLSSASSYSSSGK
jgi:cytochrome c biogenesis protein CcmG, thiol:disulfide interchange protein DsbE